MRRALRSRSSSDGGLKERFGEEETAQLSGAILARQCAYRGDQERMRYFDAFCSSFSTPFIPFTVSTMPSISSASFSATFSFGVLLKRSVNLKASSVCFRSGPMAWLASEANWVRSFFQPFAVFPRWPNWQDAGS